MLKNVAGSSFDEINLENGFRILEFQNSSDETFGLKEILIVLLYKCIFV